MARCMPEWNDKRMDHCDDCGYTYSLHGKVSVVSEILGLGDRFRSALVRPSTDSSDNYLATRRPSPEVWSAVEYGCHVRDVLLAQRERLFQALVEEEPTFVPIYRDQRVVLARYGDQIPEQVADEISFAATLTAWAFGGLDDSAWNRTCIYNFPEPSERTLLWLAQHTLHEGEHHLIDIGRVMESTPR